MSLLRVVYALRIFPKLSETFILGELAELRRRGAEVRILSLEGPREELVHPLVHDARLADVTTLEPSRFDDVVRELRPHVVHAHFATEATALARRLSERHRVPFTFTAHGYDVYRRPPGDFAQRAAAAAALITVSDANARYIERTFGVAPSKLHVIPCGVDLGRFTPNGARRSKLVVAVARLNPVKRIDLLLDACALLRERRVEFECVVVGDGRCRDELDEQRRRLHLEDWVTFVGPAVQDEVVEWWGRAGIAALSSEREGMPVALMEAAAAGVPAVAPDAGGVRELVDDGVTGIVVEPGDPSALADGLERLLRNETLSRRLGENARRRARSRFSVSAQVDGLERVWEELRVA